MPELGGSGGRRPDGNAPGGAGRKGAVKQPGKGGGGGFKSKPWEVTFEEDPRPERDSRGRQIVRATVRLDVLSSADRSRLKPQVANAKYAELTFHPRIVVEDGEHDTEELSVTSITQHTDRGDALHRSNRIRLRLPAGAATYRLTMRTAPLQHDEQTVDVVPSVALLPK